MFMLMMMLLRMLVSMLMLLVMLILTSMLMPMMVLILTPMMLVSVLRSFYLSLLFFFAESYSAASTRANSAAAASGIVALGLGVWLTFARMCGGSPRQALCRQ